MLKKHRKRTFPSCSRIDRRQTIVRLRPRSQTITVVQAAPRLQEAATLRRRRLIVVVIAPEDLIRLLIRREEPSKCHGVLKGVLRRLLLMNVRMCVLTRRSTHGIRLLLARDSVVGDFKTRVILYYSITLRESSRHSH